MWVAGISSRVFQCNNVNLGSKVLLVFGCLQPPQRNRLQPTAYFCLQKIKSESIPRIWNALQWYRQCAGLIIVDGTHTTRLCRQDIGANHLEAKVRPVGIQRLERRRHLSSLRLADVTVKLRWNLLPAEGSEQKRHKSTILKTNMQGLNLLSFLRAQRQNNNEMCSVVSVVLFGCLHFLTLHFFGFPFHPNWS